MINIRKKGERMKRKLSKKEEEFERKVEFDAQNTFKCKCGHSVVIYPNTTKKLCNWCKNYVFRNPRDEFKERMKESIKRGEY